MPPRGLQADLERDDELSAVLRVAGEIDLATAPILAAALDDVAPEGGIAGGKVVRVDMGEVTFLDSSGISVLVESRSRLADAGGHLVLHRTSSQIQRVLEISGLGVLFELESDAPG
jgi:anti-anti-sigma factor